MRDIHPFRKFTGALTAACAPSIASGPGDTAVKRGLSL